MENSKGHGKSWKISIMSWILWKFCNCTEKFCNVILLTVITNGFILLTVLVQAAGTVTTNSGLHS